MDILYTIYIKPTSYATDYVTQRYPFPGHYLSEETQSDYARSVLMPSNSIVDMLQVL